jgi:hypothetical protein
MNAIIEVVAKPTFVPAKRTTDKSLMDYAALAKEVGVEVPQLVIEDFMGVMEKKNFPIYSRREVVQYMDAKAAADGKGFGWEWKAIRKKDSQLTKKLTFGKPSRTVFLTAEGKDREDNDIFSFMILRNSSSPQRIEPASDYYNGERGKVYDKAIPMHALQRVAAIERDYAGPVCFLVSDYATEPHIKPDPFLMVVLPNVPVEQGCFVIDFWDEPGFGIDKMLAK